MASSDPADASIPEAWLAATKHDTAVPIEAVAEYDRVLRKYLRNLAPGAVSDLTVLVEIARTAEPVLLRDGKDYWFTHDIARQSVASRLMDSRTGDGLPLAKQGDRAWQKK